MSLLDFICKDEYDSRSLHILTTKYKSWEFLTSLDFEWSFLRGRRKFTWPMVRHYSSLRFEEQVTHSIRRFLILLGGIRRYL